MPLLLPGLLELSKRARYFSFHAFLLWEYRQRRLVPDPKSQSAFIKAREWELGLAVRCCPRKCGSSPVGARRLTSVVAAGPPFARGESVESHLGGYGLYYRTPLVEFGVVARAGTMLGDQPIPIDVLYEAERAQRMAAAFKAAVEHTKYYRDAMWRQDPLSQDVITEYADVACLCRLPDLPEERSAVHEALFVGDPAAPEAGVLQRRRSVAHYLALVDAHPEIVDDMSAYREALWSSPHRQDDAREVADQWAGLIAKDVWQEAVCSVWSEFCRAGLTRTRRLGRGLTWDEARALMANLGSGTFAFSAAAQTRWLVGALAAGSLALTNGEDDAVVVGDETLEGLRQLTARSDTAASGLVVFLELARRMAGRGGTGWERTTAARSVWQPSVARVISDLHLHLEADPTVADTLWWLVSHFVIPVHERIAYSKLPEFTFRFRWENELLRFYDHGQGRFPLAGIRHGSLASITRDLALWSLGADETASLTPLGRSFVEETVG